jgi:hypothetical protein
LRGQRNRRYRTLTPGFVEDSPPATAEARRRLTPLAHEAGRSFDVRAGDLNDIEALPIDGAALVTASALLDLVSETWLRRLAARCLAAGVAVHFALSYDGRIDCAPGGEADARVRDLVNLHQRTDKGFGPALGPDAGATAGRILAAEGYTVTTAASDWVLGPEMHALQAILVDGWARAAAAMAPPEAAVIDGWRARRLDHIAARKSTLRVGHEDVVARLA